MNLNPNCEKCPLHFKAEHVCMKGRWHNDGSGTDESNYPDVVFVGQAPGKEEDKSGLPFIGPAGAVLQQAIDEFHLGQAYVTNVVKCFPGTNNKGQDNAPSAGQIEACRPYLETELKTLKPKYIVAVGGHALKALTGRTGITTWAGQIAGKWNGIPVFGMLHPSYILRMPKELPRFEAHAKALAEILRPSEAKPRPDVEQVSLAAAKARLSRLTAVAFDLETSTKWPWEGGRVRTVSFSDGISGFWVQIEDKEGGLDFLKWFLTSDIEKDGHNIAFESVWSLWLFGVMPRKWRNDTLLLAHLVDENQPKALDLLASRYLDVQSWDIDPLMRLNGWTFDDAPLKELGPYNALDSVYTEQLTLPLLSKLNPGQKWCYRNILLPLAKLCARMSVRGMHIDKGWANRVAAKYSAEMVDLNEKIRATPEVAKLEAGLKKGQKLNYRSPQQMKKLLFDILKLPVGATTPSGEPSTDSKYLERLKNKPALLTNYLEWKSRETMIGKYVDKFPKYADDEDIIHPAISPAWIVTGRTAVSDPPIHGMPKGVRVDGKFDGLPRGMFTSRFKGGKMVSADYKALEFRLVCSEAEETEFINAFVNGLDPHAVTAKDLFGANWQPADRDKAKIVNFSIIYGVTEFSLAPKLGYTQEQALKVIVRFKRAHPKIFIWMERVYERVRKERIAVNRFGRVRHLPDIAGMDEWRQREILREAGNFPIQSAGADLTNLSSIEFDRQAREQNLQSKLVLNYHDALYVDAHPDEVELVSKLLVKVMKEEVPGRCKWLRLPLDVDVKVEDRWGGAKNF